MSTPILSKKFFEQHTPDSGFFSKWRSSGPWSEKCLPVYEWDGVLFIGCLYPPADFPKLTAKAVFVLCDPESLKNVWYEYQGTVVGKSAPLKPAPLKMDDMPEGLSAALTSTPSAPEALSMDSLAADIGAPDLSADDGNILVDTAEEPEASPPVESLELADEPTVTTPKIDSNDFLKAAPAAPATAAPTTPQPQPAASAASENIYTKPGALSAKKDLNEKPKDFHPEVTRISVSSLKNTPKASLDSFMQSIFTEMEYHFEKTMVFLKDGEEMKPWRWDGNFQMNADEGAAPAGIQLNTPSPWRIVMRTQKPYHGYLTANPINDKFFEAWNNAQPPEHLTLVPVMIEDHVIGMLLGIGLKPSDEKASLQLAEKLATEISQTIRNQPEFLKASSN